MLLRATAGLLVLLAACSPPTPLSTATPPTAYVWPDALPRYFPEGVAEVPVGTKEALPLNSDPALRGCRAGYEFAAENLAAFGAPVLPHWVLGPSVYRCLWLRQFHRPVLLTLTCASEGGKLRTQFLSKQLNILAPRLPDPHKTGIDSAERQRRRRELAGTAFMAQYRAAKDYATTPVLVSDTAAVIISEEQLWQFRQRLREVNFWQLPSCPPDQNALALDVADWLLEVRGADRYHVIYRHNPQRRTAIRHCCELLLDWSPACREERY